MRRLAAVFAAVFVPAVLGAQRPQCVAAPLPDPLPIAMQLVDSMTLSASLAKSVVVPTTFSLWYDKAGQLTHVLALTDSLVVRGVQPDEGSLARAALGRVVADAAFPQDSGRATSVRLTIARDSVGAMSLEVARSVNCSTVALPHFRPPNERYTVTAEEIDDYQHATPASVTFVIDRDGHPLEVLISRSSGSRLIDSRVVEVITSTRYLPATVDGFTKQMTMHLNSLPPIPASRHGPSRQRRRTLIGGVRGRRLSAADRGVRNGPQHRAPSARRRGAQDRGQP